MPTQALPTVVGCQCHIQKCPRCGARHLIKFRVNQRSDEVDVGVNVGDGDRCLCRAREGRGFQLDTQGINVRYGDLFSKASRYCRRKPL